MILSISPWTFNILSRQELLNQVWKRTLSTTLYAEVRVDPSEFLCVTIWYLLRLLEVLVFIFHTWFHFTRYTFAFEPKNHASFRTKYFNEATEWV